MSRKRTTYSAEFKSKVVLEILEGEKTLNEIASKYDLLPKNIQNWKRQFLDNASLAFDKSAVVKEYARAKRQSALGVRPSKATKCPWGIKMR